MVYIGVGTMQTTPCALPGTQVRQIRQLHILGLNCFDHNDNNNKGLGTGYGGSRSRTSEVRGDEVK